MYNTQQCMICVESIERISLTTGSEYLLITLISSSLPAPLVTSHRSNLFL